MLEGLLEESNRKNKEDCEVIEKTIVGLIIQVEEEKRIQEVLTSQLKEKEDICQERDIEIVSLRKELEKIVRSKNWNLKIVQWF